MSPNDVNWSVPTLSEAVSDWIATGIVRGRWSAGDRLREIEVCGELGVSRAPVREALRMLQERGLVHLVPRIGAVVNHFSTETVMDVYELRATIEHWVCLQSVPALEQDDLDQLGQMLEQLREARAAGDYDRFFEVGWSFRTTLYSGTTNGVALEMIGQLRSRLHSIPQVLRRDERHLDETIAAYETSLAAARAGDATTVGDTIASFMKGVGVEVCEKFSTVTVEFPPLGGDSGKRGMS